MSADAGPFLTNLLARARYKLFVLGFFLLEEATAERVVVQSGPAGRFVKRALILSPANHQP